MASLETDDDVTILNDGDEMIATVVPPRVEEEEVPVEEELEGEVDEDAEEGAGEGEAEASAAEE